MHNGSEACALFSGGSEINGCALSVVYFKTHDVVSICSEEVV